jgi:hypothetical protein
MMVVSWLRVLFDGTFPFLSSAYFSFLRKLPKGGGNASI